MLVGLFSSELYLRSFVPFPNLYAGSHDTRGWLDALFLSRFVVFVQMRLMRTMCQVILWGTKCK